MSHEKLPLGVTSTLNQGVPARGSREIELSCFVTDRQKTQAKTICLPHFMGDMKL